jgi:hypothetical protein
MTMALNRYQDLFYVVCCCTAAIYIWGYIGKLIGNNIIGEFLALLGRESLYFMALHILGFFICNSMLLYFDIVNMDSTKGLYTYEMNGSWPILGLYILFAILVPYVIICGFRYCNKKVISYIQYIKSKSAN